MRRFKDIPSIIANEKLKDDYDMNTTHMLLVDRAIVKRKILGKC